LLALTLNGQNSADERARSLTTNLQSQALRSATGAHWETKEGAQLNLGTPVFNTAVVSLALARLDPASSVLTDAVRYVAFNRKANGLWSSSYESTWVLMALTEVMRGTGELAASFGYSAALNDSQVAKGQAGGSNALTSVETSLPLSSMHLATPNSLKITHEAGTGRLYYRAFLQVNRPVEQVAPLNRGLSISRDVVLAGQDCVKQTCPAVSSVKLSEQKELLVRVTLTLPQAMYHLVVEDYIPAGAEIVDASLKTTQKGGQLAPEPIVPYLLANPLGSGWNWWLFGAPKVYDDHIRWTAAYLAPGTYVLTYRLSPLQAGEFRLLPAHAYETYFPEVEGSSAGAIFRIDP
jgi:alpha-2-macroglobulin